MTPVALENPTKRFHAPKDWDEEANGPCETLDVIAHEGFFYSYWRPTWREVFDLIRGRSMRIAIAGGQPAISLDVTEPGK